MCPGRVLNHGRVIGPSWRFLSVAGAGVYSGAEVAELAATRVTCLGLISALSTSPSPQRRKEAANRLAGLRLGLRTTSAVARNSRKDENLGGPTRAVRAVGVPPRRAWRASACNFHVQNEAACVLVGNARAANL